MPCPLSHRLLAALGGLAQLAVLVASIIALCALGEALTASDAEAAGLTGLRAASSGAAQALFLASGTAGLGLAVYGGVYGLGRLVWRAFAPANGPRLAAPETPRAAHAAFPPRVFETPEEVAIRAARQLHADAIAWLRLGDLAEARSLRAKLEALDLSCVYDGGRQEYLREHRLMDLDLHLAEARA